MNVTCTKCGWVHFAVTRAFAEAEVERFNTYFATLTKEEQDLYYSGEGSSIKSYEHCNLCSGKDFRPSQPDDCPDGCTIGPVIYEP